MIVNRSTIEEGRPGKMVVGKGPHAGQDMFRLLPGPGVRPALLPLLLLRPNARIRQAVEHSFHRLQYAEGGGGAARPILGIHLRGLDGDCR